MRNIFFLLAMMLTNATHADVYKCVKDGKVSYSENRCDGTGNNNPINSPAGLKEGLAAFESGDYELAYSQLNPMAESGVALAQNTVGRMHLLGQGVPKNPDKALILFRKAAKQGLPNAKNNIGVMYASGNTVPQDYKQAFVWIREAADQGFALAMNNLADMYENGAGVKPNRAEANKWRKKAQDIGITVNSTPVTIETVGKKEYEKGLAYYYGWDFVRAAEWFQLAATKGHPEAQLKLASLYELGQGVNKNEEQARYWIQKAKNSGHTMDDNRDRITLIDSSSSEGTRKAPSMGARP